jgi:hypothetical protein
MFASLSFAFDTKTTHPQLTEKAIEHAAKLEDVLGNRIGIENGVGSKLSINVNREFTIKEWLKKGSEGEDDPICRANNHFHDPTEPWDEAMLTDSKWYTDNYCAVNYPAFNDKFSNITWATGFVDKEQALLTPPVNNDPYINNGRNWSVARDFFYKSLIAPASIDRERYLAETFLTLGHVLHLLQDMAVPAHTRNDFSQGHIQNIGCPGGKLWCGIDRIGNPFEGYVRDYFDKEILPLIKNNISESYTGEKSLTNFWDTDTVTSPQTGFDIGLAEYSNMNFVSQTVFSKYAHPSRDGIENEYPGQISQEIFEIMAKDGRLEKGVYVTKNKNGDQPGEKIDKFLKPRYMLYSHEINPDYWDRVYKVRFTLDDQCHNEYAQKLIPRAIGYSASLLDYFFRGKLEISPPTRFVYSVVDGSDLPYRYINRDGTEHYQQQFSVIKAKVRNVTPQSSDAEGNVISYEQMGKGEIVAVARYKMINNYLPDLSNYPPSATDIDEVYSYSVSAVIPVVVNENGISFTTAKEFLFDFRKNPIPVGISDLTLQVVFKGSLGNENNGAVAIGMKDLSEPDHHVFWNSTDQVVIDYNLYTGVQIRSDPYLFNYVDLNNNGILNEVGEPYIDPYPVSFDLGFSEQDPRTTSDPVYLSARIMNLPPARYSRLIILTDQPDPLSNWITAVTRANPWNSNATTHNYYSFNAASVLVAQEDQITPLMPAEYVFRGVWQHHFLTEFYCSVIDPRLRLDADACLSQSGDRTIPGNLDPYPAQLFFP